MWGTTQKKKKIDVNADVKRVETGLVNTGFEMVLIVAALSVLTGVSIYVLNLVNAEQPKPYMDEIFHIPQTQKYCEGNFTAWDPKITTLPGTYVVTRTVLSVVNLIRPSEDPCSTYNLRAVNVGVNIVNVCLIYYILRFYNPNMSPAKRVLSAINIGTFPILCFFSFLYYTDAIATMCLLLMHCSFLSGNFGYSGIAGAYAVFARQTNIVWVFYHGISSVLNILTNLYGDLIFLLPLEIKKFFLSLRPGGRANKGKRNNKSGKKGSKTVVRPPSAQQIPSLTRLWKECGDDFVDHGCGYILVGILFVIFVVYNGSIVVGDKQAHQATMNIPQVFYFALVFGAFTLPFMASRVRSVGMTLISNPQNLVVMAVLFATIIYINSPAHPYLLADNRHYTFYVWRRFYANIPCLRYVWIPFYIMVWTLISTTMGVQKVLLCNYIFCTVINLVPQLLMEFRYFIPAYMFARLTFQNATWCELILEFLNHLIVNSCTIYVFLNIRFMWGGSSEAQRFMW